MLLICPHQVIDRVRPDVQELFDRVDLGECVRVIVEPSYKQTAVAADSRPVHFSAAMIYHS